MSKKNKETKRLDIYGVSGSTSGIMGTIVGYRCGTCGIAVEKKVKHICDRNNFDDYRLWIPMY